MMARDVTDFPLPDSPTNPRDSPVAIEKLRSRTAAIEPKVTSRCTISRSSVDMLCFHTTRTLRSPSSSRQL